MRVSLHREDIDITLSTMHCRNLEFVCELGRFHTYVHMTCKHHTYIEIH